MTTDAASTIECNTAHRMNGNPLSRTLISLSKTVERFLAVTLLILMMMSGATAVFVTAFKWIPVLGTTAWIAAVFYLILLVVVFYFISKIGEEKPDSYWLSPILFFVTLIKFAILFSAPAYLQTADRGIFSFFVERLGQGGTIEKNLEFLSQYYDYYLWPQRAFPFALPLYLLFGEHHVTAMQVLNIVLSTVNILLLYKITRQVTFHFVIQRITVVVFAFFPLRIWNVLDYSHQIHAEFFMLLFLLLLFRSVSIPSARSCIISSIYLGLLLFALHLQRGVDLLLIIILFAFVATALLRGTAGGQLRKKNAAILVLMPLIIFMPLSKAFDHWRDRHDLHRLSSGTIGFMARGWSIQTLGEYDGHLEQIDRVTPADLKKEVMIAYPISQLHYNFKAVLLKLLPAKLTKYFLVGYASGIEESLETSGYTGLRDIFRGMRLVFAPLFLGCTALGCWHFFKRPSSGCHVPILFIFPLISCAIFVLLGETSPRYSYYVHAALAILAGVGASGLICRPVSAIASRSDFFRLGITSAVLIVFYFAAIYLAHLGINQMALAHVFRDVSKATTVNASGPTGPSSAIEPDDYYQRELLWDKNNLTSDAIIQDELILQRMGQTKGESILYLWPVGTRDSLTGMICAIDIDGTEHIRLHVSEIPSIQIVTLPWSATTTNSTVIRIRLKWDAVEPGTMHAGSGIRWGYVYDRR